MAQERWWNWLDDDSTFRMNVKDLILLPHGRYCGFDFGFVGMNLVLEHSQTGKTKVDILAAATPNLGIWKTKQGAIIQEDAPILPLPVNTGHPTLDRIDLVVGQHEYIETVGGATAIYKIIQGTPAASPVPPALPDPNKQVILGQLYIAAGTTSLGVGLYSPATVPNFAQDDTIMHTDQVQCSTALKEFNIQKGKFASATLDVANKKLILSEASNFYMIDTLIGSAGGGQYLEVADLELQFNGNAFVGGGHLIKFVSKYKLKITSTLGKIFPRHESMFIETFEDFDLLDVTGANFIVPSIYLAVKGGLVAHNKANKFTKIQMLNKGDALNLNNSTGQLPIDKEGNFFEVDGTGLWGIFKFMSSPHLFHSNYQNPSGEAGTEITLKFNIAAILSHNASGTIPTNYKPLHCPNLGDFGVSVGTIMTLVEDNTHWRIKGVHNQLYSPVNLYNQIQQLSNVPTGCIMDWAITGTVPSGWVAMQGQNLSVTGFPDLFAVLGYTYGGSGAFFSLPDSRDRFSVGAGGSYAAGDTGGANQVALTVNEMPSHGHEVISTSPEDGLASPSSYIPVPFIVQAAFRSIVSYLTTQPSKGIVNDAIRNEGGGVAHENRPPYLSLIKIIKYA